MTGPLSLSDALHPPSGLPEMADWFESLSYGLVLLEPYTLDDVRSAVFRFREGMTQHVADWDAMQHPPERRGTPWEALRRVVDSDHIWFETSFDQLGWFLGLAEGEDYGGHRQALGQYGRLVAEAVRRHLADERRWLERRQAAAKG